MLYLKPLVEPDHAELGPIDLNPMAISYPSIFLALAADHSGANKTSASAISPCVCVSNAQTIYSLHYKLFPFFFSREFIRKRLAERDLPLFKYTMISSPFFDHT